MAQMEKITYPALIDHFKEADDFYNELLKNHELQYGTINTELLREWMIDVVEPILRSVDSQKSGHLPRICKLLFSKILLFQSRKSSIAYTQETKAALLICKEIPALFVEAPHRILEAIESAMRSLRQYQPLRVGVWIDLMCVSVEHCKSINDFLDCGRVCAWLCGLAHLKSRVKNVFKNLPDQVRSAIKNNTSHPDFEKLFNKNWNQKTALTFVTAMGDFKGFGGPFETPPVIVNIENQIFATDGKHALALFADQFGQVLVEQNAFSAEQILNKLDSKINVPKGINFKDIQSISKLEDTLLLTRTSSYCVFVYTN